MGKKKPRTFSMSTRKYIITAAMVFIITSSYPLLIKSEEEGREDRFRDMGKFNRNKKEREEWFRDLGFGIFIHWSVDSQVGSVISHSLVGSTRQYQDKFFNELPKTFDPSKFDGNEIVSLFKLAGAKYVVFTAKHHSGFCMFDTKTTEFDIVNTPYGRDITRELIAGMRKWNLGVGLYFSPDDFHVLYTQNKEITRRRPEAFPQNNAELMERDMSQIHELLTNYGSIDIMFIDYFENPSQEILDSIWKTQPRVVVTRGAMHTPEQTSPGKPLQGAWETCHTMGSQWQYKAAHDTYKDGTYLIQLLIETRAKGGNLLLNVGPKPTGELPYQQEEVLREIGMWMMVNSEGIYDVRPWIITNEDNIWFTKSKDHNIVYAFITKTVVGYGKRKEVVIRSLKAVSETSISVLGATGNVLEYEVDIDTQTKWYQGSDGLHVSFMRLQRIYDDDHDHPWPNPVTLKIENAEPATW